MIGTPVDITLPELSDPFATSLANIRDALQALADSIADKATTAALTINTDFDLGGNALTDVTSVQFEEGNAPSVAGALYYTDGEFYGISEAGVVKLTSEGAINAAGIGGIVGDYGGTNPAALAFDDASGEYRFTEDTGDWADVAVHDVVLEGANGSVRLTVDDAISTARTVKFKSLPASGISMLVYDASDSGVKDGAATRATNEQLFTDIDASGSVTANDFNHTSNFVEWVSTAAYVSTDPGSSKGIGQWTMNANGAYVYIPLDVRSGDKIIDVTVYGYKNSNAFTTFTAQLYKIQADDPSNNTVLQQIDVTSTGALAFAFAGVNETVATGYTYEIAVSQSGTISAADYLYSTAWYRQHP